MKQVIDGKLNNPIIIRDSNAIIEAITKIMNSDSLTTLERVKKVWEIIK